MASEVREVALSRTQRALIRVLAPSSERAGIVSDLNEEAAQITARDGRRAAARFLRWQVAHSAGPWLRRRTGEGVVLIRRSMTMAYRGLWSDVRLASRRLLHSRGFTVLAVVTLAIGIGAVSTAFSLAHALWLKPLPYQDPDRLVWLQSRFAQTNTTGSLRVEELTEYRKPSRSLSAVAGFSYGATIAKVNGEPVRVASYFVSPNLFRVLGVAPAVGRDFLDADADRDTHVVMLSDAIWAKRFDRDPNVAGKTMTLFDAQYQIAGVMPRGFTFPRVLDADVWIPVGFNDRPEDSGRVYQAIARLAVGSSIADASAEIEVRAKALALAYPKTNKDWTSLVSPAGATASRASQVAFQALLGIVGLFLLIACTNLAGLLLARNAVRRTEFAVCLSIGASRWRLARMLLVESVMLAGLGCAVGVVLAAYGSRALASFMPPKTPGLDGVGLSLEVVGVAALVSIVSAALIGVLPALSLRSLKPSEAVAGGRSVARGTARAQRVLIVVEVALAVILLVGAGAMVRSFVGLLNRDRGYEPRGLLTLEVSLPFSDDSYLDKARRARAFQNMIDRVAAVPGVVRAAATTGFPGSPLGILGTTPIVNEGRPAFVAAVHAASVDFFKTMGIPVVAGRPFAPTDATTTARVVIVNEALAREFPDGTAVGRQIQVSVYGKSQSREIIGVVGNIKLTGNPTPRMFVPMTQESAYWVDLVFRSDAGPAATPAVRNALRAISPDLLIENESSFQKIISDSIALERAESACAGMIAVLSSIVAGIGIYALMTFVAAQRRRELGIRVALGSQPRRLFLDALFGALRLVGAGVVLGLIATVLLVRGLSSQVFGLTSADVATHAGAAAFVFVVATIAVWIPARRVMRTDPLIALRGD